MLAVSMDGQPVGQFQNQGSSAYVHTHANVQSLEKKGTQVDCIITASLQ